jgi:hypothetical protein
VVVAAIAASKTYNEYHVHHRLFGIDISNGAALRRRNMYSCIIIYTCCHKCSSCVGHYFRCVKSSCEV